ncbi:MAG TPA: hypothetical protein DD706_00630 [Nitrospiraceae bacterium]|nr:hypothetical protein [Nitrospiraceae bacterium]
MRYINQISVKGIQGEVLIGPYNSFLIKFPLSARFIDAIDQLGGIRHFNRDQICLPRTANKSTDRMMVVRVCWLRPPLRERQAKETGQATEPIRSMAESIGRVSYHRRTML